MLPMLPDSVNVFVLRTDFSDDDIWQMICRQILAPTPEDGFFSVVNLVDDRVYESASLDAIAKIVPDHHTFVFVIDAFTINHREHPILCLDLYHQAGAFRLVPYEFVGVENNLSVANMDFEEFRDNVDPDGIFRGFR
jgi:hypothetical protein